MDRSQQSVFLWCLALVVDSLGCFVFVEWTLGVILERFVKNKWLLNAMLRGIELICVIDIVEKWII